MIRAALVTIALAALALMGCQSHKRITEGRTVENGSYQIPENNLKQVPS
jgi:uncharacterized protein YcfL